MADRGVPFEVKDFPENMKDPLLWNYRCEGSWTLVLSLRKYRKVLRLKKRERGTTSSNIKDNLHAKETVRNLNFAKVVISRLMGNNYVNVGDLIAIPQGFAETVNEISQSIRPDHRVHKVVDERCKVGVLISDFAFLPLPSEHQRTQLRKHSSSELQASFPNLSVELKPKCGFLPVSPFIDSTRTVKYSVCHYCMLQKLKVKEGKYSRESKYCPLDLFSGNSWRVSHALECLVSDPQNNFRVFCDGQGIFTEELVQEAIKDRKACCAERFLEISLEGTKAFECFLIHSDHKCGNLGPLANNLLEILLQILVDDSIRGEDSTDRNCVKHSPQVCQRSTACKKGVNFKSKEFGKGGVLQRLLSIQKLDGIDVEAIYPLYKKVINYFESNPDTRHDLGVDGPISSPLWTSVASSLDNADNISNNCALADSLTPCNSVSADTLDLSNQKNLYRAVLEICRFAVAATVKDCSMMVAFQKTSGSDSSLPTITDPFSGDLYQYDINLVDLDPKEFDRVVKYYKDSLRVVENYLS